MKPAKVWDKLTSVGSGRQYNAAEARDTRVAARAWSAARCDLIGGRRGVCGRGAQYANEVIDVLPPYLLCCKGGKRSREQPCAHLSHTHTHTHPIVFNSLFSGHMFIISFIHFIHFYTLNVHFVSYKNLDLTKQHTFKTHRCIVFFILCLLPACMRLIFWNSLLSGAASAFSSHAEGCLTKQEPGLPRSEGSSV